MSRRPRGREEPPAARMPADWRRLAGAARRASRRAHSPDSRQRVGAALEGKRGKVYAACNVENSSFGLTICAERAALFRAVAEGERKFRRLAIYTPDAAPVSPCGACRQVLAEFCHRLPILSLGRGGRGKEFDLAAFVAAEAKKDEKERVKAVTLIFWSLQCPSGVACTKRIKAMAEDSKGKPVLVLGVNSNVNESGEAWKEYLRKAGADVRVLMDADGAVARQFGAKAVTTTVVLDVGGVLRYWGAIDNGKDLGQDGREAYVENAMKAISEGKEVTPAKTSPKG